MPINYDAVHPIDPKANQAISPVIARQRLLFALGHISDIRSDSMFNRFLDDAVAVLPNLRRSSLRDAFEGKICAAVGVMEINRLKMRLDEIMLLADVCETLAAKKHDIQLPATETIDEPAEVVVKRGPGRPRKDVVLKQTIG